MILLKLALHWAAAAQRSREEAAPPRASQSNIELIGLAESASSSVLD